VIAILAIIVATGPLMALRSIDRWDTWDRPAWAPSGRIAVVTGLASTAVEALAVWLVWDEHGWSLPIYLWLAHVALAPLWWASLVGSERLSAGFTLLCVDWTALAIAAAAFSAFTPVAGWIVALPLAWLTWMGAAVFFLWQANQPSRR
jgi:tryptophan-rich sensory protein